ncbi:hypothetical protein [Polaribacter sp. HL-MS24]|uniref:hypothetical protein n=1 Tax=Polaribacter sp. HL-MS24 TaxID=3077735 RepID=UPI0029349CE5|nr:hypothetical protein [Polaribacter sp. HL-MS24]WOC40120.1 hypothetical protein RRF69_11000 [Polaribacter sp. HL-MS24]
MKNVNKLTLTVLLIFGILISSCQEEFNENTELTEPVAEIDTSKLIDFKGLPVNHRFSTPIKDLEIKHTEENLKHLYQTSKRAVAKQKGLAFKAGNSELPNAEIIAEVT